MKFTLILLTMCCFLSCNDDLSKNPCNVNNPLQEITWLNDLETIYKNDPAPQRILQYTYDGRIVFMIDGCFQCPDAMTLVYDCEQNQICQFGGIMGKNTCPDFESNASNRKLIYED